MCPEVGKCRIEHRIPVARIVGRVAELAVTLRLIEPGGQVEVDETAGAAPEISVAAVVALRVIQVETRRVAESAGKIGGCGHRGAL